MTTNRKTACLIFLVATAAVLATTAIPIVSPIVDAMLAPYFEVDPLDSPPTTDADIIGFAKFTTGPPHIFYIDDLTHPLVNVDFNVKSDSGCVQTGRRILYTLVPIGNVSTDLQIHPHILISVQVGMDPVCFRVEISESSLKYRIDKDPLVYVGGDPKEFLKLLASVGLHPNWQPSVTEVTPAAGWHDR